MTTRLLVDIAFFQTKAILSTLGDIHTHFDKAKYNSYVIARRMIVNVRHNSRTDIYLQYRRQADEYPDIGSDRYIVSE